MHGGTMSEKSDYDAAKAAHEQNVHAAERAHDRIAKLEDMFNENSDRHAHAVIRIILVLNGGVGIALLAFVGGVAGRTQIGLDRVSSFASQLQWFVYGALISYVAALSAYIVS